MNLRSAIIGFFTALPGIVKLIQLFMEWLLRVSGNDPTEYLKKVAEAMDLLNKAKSDQERIDAAKKISELIGGVR